MARPLTPLGSLGAKVAESFEDDGGARKLAISQAESLRRVSVRPGHFYPPSLVASQFEALQDPSAEAGVLTLDGDEPLEALARRAAVWLTGAGR